MAAKILANLLVAGGTVLFRAASQAYKQAIINGTKAGMTAEGVQAAAKASKQLTVQEARQILGIETEASWEEIMQKFEHLFKANEKNGSFYLQSKIYRAKERLEQEFEEEGKPMPPYNPPSSSGGDNSSSSDQQQQSTGQ